jgi:hypothetical protein
MGDLDISRLTDGRKVIGFTTCYSWIKIMSNACDTWLQTIRPQDLLISAQVERKTR